MRRRALLLVNTSKPDAVEAEREVRSIIEQHGVLVGEADGTESETGEDGSTFRDVDLAIVLGGDGTLLGHARRLGHLNIPLLGVNFGKLGFLAEFDLDAFRRQAQTLLTGDQLPVRMLKRLRAEVYGTDGTLTRSGTALNDVVITAGPPFRMIELGLRVDGYAGPKLLGDGLIVSTPTGSTAYNLSAGGPIMEPGVGGIAVTPIAAHTLAFRPIVVPSESRIELELHRTNTDDSDTCGGGGTTLLLDGVSQGVCEEGERIMIRQDESPIAFVRNTERPFWQTLVQKMHWAKTPTLRGDG